MTTHAGYDVLDLVPALIDGATRSATVALGAEALRAPWAGDGVAAYRATGAAPTWRSTFAWVAEDRAALAALDAFFAARAGRLVPFWCPTFHPDLTVLGTASAGHQWIVRACDYTAQRAPLFAALGVKDRVYARHPDGRWTIARVDGATDNGDGTETLSLNGVTTSATGGVPTPVGLDVSFGHLARLDDDAVTIRHLHDRLALVEASVVTLLREQPAS